MRWIVLLVASLIVASAHAREQVAADSTQLVLVVTADWNANQGTLHTFQRESGQWVVEGSAIPVSIGRAGAAWGIGLHDAQTGLQKREGDGRSPAGVFALGTAFGYTPAATAGIPYRAMTEFDYCIDVSDSPFYNQLVDARNVGRASVEKSTEPMRRDIHANGDQRYKLGFVIKHNPRNVSEQGSCIFAHLWGSPAQTTAGCTAMDERVMRELLAWLDDAAKPLFVLLPYPEYRRVARDWQLPADVSAPR